MCDQSEMDELYDEFLDLDGNPFSDFNLDAKYIARELSESGERQSRRQEPQEGSNEKWNHLGDMYSNYRNNNVESSANSDVKNLNNILNAKKGYAAGGGGDDDDDDDDDGGGDDEEDDLIEDLDVFNSNVLVDRTGNYLDKNGKIQSRVTGSEFSSLKYNNQQHQHHHHRPSRPTSLFTKVKECEVDAELKEVDEQRTSPEISQSDDTFHRNDWGPESLGLWHSGPSSLSLGQTSNAGNAQQDLCNVMSFTAGVESGSQAFSSFSSSTRRAYSHQQLGAKVEMVYSLLSMLGTSNRSDMSKTLLAMSSSPESCLAMRQSGCLPLLIQLIHSPDLDIEVRGRAAEALQNIVLAQTDEKKRRREARVLKLLHQIREYCDDLKILATDHNSAITDEPEKHPVTAIEALMKFSFDAEHRQAMCSLGGLHAIAELIQLDHEVHGSLSDNPLCITLRRYAGMSLTNLIFGDGNNKALLCSFSKFMRALVSQLMSPSEDLRQVTASVLRNLSWRADAESKQALREIGAVTALMVAAMEGKKESTLKSILSALWNLSAHCSMNKVDVCAVPGAVAFLVKMLKYKAASNTLAVVENAGGILRNISSHIAIREDYRQILRDNNCFEILLEQLKSPSLTIVSNACGTLWNLSARCPEDQRRLWEMGAISMLRSLIQSKHRMISMGSSAALKNLLSANPGGNMFNHLDSTAKGLGLQNLPTLFVRKQRALEQELDINLSETCDNIEPSGSPVHSDKNFGRTEEQRRTAAGAAAGSGSGAGGAGGGGGGGGAVAAAAAVAGGVGGSGTISKRSDSHESVTSTQSDSAYERVNQLMVKNENKVLENKNVTMHGSLNDNQSGRKADEQKLIRRYKSSMIPTPAFKKMSQEKKNEKTKGESASSESTEKSTESSPAAKKAPETKEKRGIPVLKNRLKAKQEMQGHETTNCGQCLVVARSNFVASQYDEEFPVNYSLKYAETEVYGGGDVAGESAESKSKKDLKEKESFEEYPDYAETDLDQPTDFSLKYGEETSSDEELKNQAFNYYEGDKTKESGYYSGQQESEDTTRTYYTEGTPYEGTPYNFSSSNSMSDLRIDHGEGREENGEGSFQREKGDASKMTPEESSRASSEKECQNVYADGAGDYGRRAKRLQRDFESGVSTPERPVQYCEEGTPGGCFSRVSSLSSLTGGKDSSRKNSPDAKSDKKEDDDDGGKDLKKGLETEDGLQGKAVTFAVTQQYECADQTPLMFSRSSSMNSLSSFEQIHQSIPDDRSSVVSDFSRMTSGLVSPSELPDSPTQTVPPSPKQCKAPAAYFPGKTQESQKKSVFEDAVATYKQEDTPIEFSRATSLSSLNIENSVKQDFILKTNSSASSVASADESKAKEDKDNSLEKNQTDDLKEQIVPEKNELEREKLELESVTEVDENILVDCINIGIQENSRRPRSKCPDKKSSEMYLTSPVSQDGSRHAKKVSSGIPVKTTARNKFHGEAKKVYSTYEESEDMIHTYYTEGTPANVSHAGSHSDLSNLSMVTGNLLPTSTIEDTSDDGSFCSGDTENILAECIQSGMPKAKHQKEKSKGSSMDLTMMKRPELSVSKIHGGRGGVINSDPYAGHQACSDYLRRKDHHHLTAKDEVSTFATENSPCNFSVRSSLSDLTVNSVDSPVCLSRPEVNRDPIPQVMPSAQVPSKPSSNSICVIESVEEGKTSGEREKGIFGLAKKLDKESSYWDERTKAQGGKSRETSFASPTENDFSGEANAATVLSRHESLSSLSVESFDSSEPTPLEQALLEQCIHSGMPRKSHSKKPELKNYKTLDTYDELMRISSGADAKRTGPDPCQETDSSKNVNTSSAAVDENTDADEKRPRKTGQENAAAATTTATKTTTTITTEHSNRTSSKGENVAASAATAADGSDSVDGIQGDNFGGHTWSEDYTSPNENSASYASYSDKMGLRVVGETPDNSAGKDAVVTNFKIGSEVRDPKIIQAEATKICREIRKYQELDMNCSMTSEVSQLSCNSFLDSGEFSFIDLTKENGELDTSESLNKSQRKLSQSILQARATSLAVLEEPISLPSIGSAKSDLLQDADLESSILSVASLTSEVAESSLRDRDVSDCNREKTPENAVDSPVTVFDRGDDTLNAETLGSDTEVFDDENSTMSQENLPLDEESTPKKLNRKLTPKEKRQTIQDRYRTYTIHDFKAEMAAEANDAEQQRKKRTTPKERRLNERDRFLTKVLGKDSVVALTRGDKDSPAAAAAAEEEPLEMDVEETYAAAKRPISLDSATPALFASKPESERWVNDEAVNPLEDLLPVNPVERHEILQNAKLVAISLKTAAQDVDSEGGFVSDSDAEGSHKTVAIDTATYNKHTPVEIDYRLSDEDYHNGDYSARGSEEEEEEGEGEGDEEEKKGPRILKGEKQPEEATEAAAKAIRGRRKQIYSSPARRAVQSATNSVPASPKIASALANAKKFSLSTTKSLPNVPKSIGPKTDCPTTLCREGTFTKEEGPAVKPAPAKIPRNSIPVLAKASATARYKSAPALRGNKANPENAARPARPVSSYISKTHNSNSVGASATKPVSAVAAKVPSNIVPPSARKASSYGPSSAVKSSASNSNLKGADAAKSTASVRPRSTLMRTAKSQSNGSLDAEQAAKVKPKTPKKEVTSKIASLWKKVEDTKRKERGAKDTRVWITPDNDGKSSGGELVIEKEEILELSSGKVVRSSTFQALGEENSNLTPGEDLRKKSHRNSGDFYSAKWQGERRDNFDGRNIISAIVPPYNYNPPNSVQIPSSPTVKQVDTYHKGSVKVTLV